MCSGLARFWICCMLLTDMDFLEFFIFSKYFFSCGSHLFVCGLFHPIYHHDENFVFPFFHTVAHYSNKSCRFPPEYGTSTPHAATVAFRATPIPKSVMRTKEHQHRQNIPPLLPPQKKNLKSFQSNSASWASPTM